jgi:hypothetical protein
MGVTITIVAQGQAGTPGPHGAPPDNASFSLNVTIKAEDATTGQRFNPFQDTLTVTGQPDPNGGTVCGALDDNQPHRFDRHFSDGTPYHEIFTFSCEGNYKGGMISYTETATGDQLVFDDGSHITCAAPAFIYEKLTGSFSNSTSSSGDYSAAGRTLTCTSPNEQQFMVQYDPLTGTWIGTK